MVGVDGLAEPLTVRQLLLPEAFAVKAGRIIGRGELIELLWGNQSAAFDRSIVVRVCRLRTTSGDAPCKPCRIVTIRGVGYLFVDRPDEPSTVPTARDGVGLYRSV